MSQEQYCPLCNTSFGSAEPRRTRADGRVVHERCIFAKNRKDAYIEVCVAFVRKNVGEDEADQFAAAVKRNHSPGLFAAALSRTLRVGWNKRSFKAFAARIGGELTFEVALPPPSAAKLRAVGSDD